MAERSAAPAGIRRRANSMVVLEIVGAVAVVASMVAVVRVCGTLLDDRPSRAVLWWSVAAAAIAGLVALAAQVVSRLVGRTVTDTTRSTLHAGVVARLRGGYPARALHAAWRTHGVTLGRDLVNAGVAAGRTGSELLSSSLVALLSIGYLFWADWRLGLVCLLPVLVGVAAFSVLTARFNRDFREEYEQRIGEFDAIRPVIGLNVRINSAGNRGRVALVARAAARQLGTTTTEFSSYFVARIGKLLGGRSIAEIAFSPLIVLVVVLCGGVLMEKAGWLTAIDLLAFLVVAVGLNAPLLATTYFLEDLVEGRKALGRLAEFAAGAPADPAAAEHGSDALTLPATGVLTVVDDAPERVLDRVLATVPPGDVAAVDAEQAVVLGPVGDYLAGGAVVDREAIERAARAVGVHDTIAAFPRGYDSVVGEDVSLSYSESQRLALARAVAGGRRVVLLDQRAFRDDVDALRAAVAELEQRVAVCTVTDSAPVLAGPVVRLTGDTVEPEQRSTEYGKVAR